MKESHQKTVSSTILGQCLGNRGNRTFNKDKLLQENKYQQFREAFATILQEGQKYIPQNTYLQQEKTRREQEHIRNNILKARQHTRQRTGYPLCDTHPKDKNLIGITLLEKKKQMQNYFSAVIVNYTELFCE